MFGISGWKWNLRMEIPSSSFGRTIRMDPWNILHFWIWQIEKMIRLFNNVSDQLINGRSYPILSLIEHISSNRENRKIQVKTRMPHKIEKCKHQIAFNWCQSKGVKISEIAVGLQIKLKKEKKIQKAHGVFVFLRTYHWITSTHYILIVKKKKWKE